MRILHENPEFHGAKRRFFRFCASRSVLFFTALPLFGKGVKSNITVTV
ncbi:hypothetical protein CLOSYM_04441 [[Clostridium] symbiosum ATCC 14940]|uniref:Uncharacterized protein n=1 Tax=[Clostridium] symbiosum ATCC 14940 TaxID=411472 RepID=A0ABC9TRP8_CLOSY|nr:hypothetical protein CLOSYM_04441 [[Clostridium] symbiosum ATCC 14940]